MGLLHVRYWLLRMIEKVAQSFWQLALPPSFFTLSKALNSSPAILSTSASFSCAHKEALYASSSLWASR